MASEDRVEWLAAIIVLEVSSLLEFAPQTSAQPVFKVAL